MTDVMDKKDEIGALQPGAATEKAQASGGIQAAAAPPKPQKKRAGIEGPWMYVGPTIPGIGIQNRVYTEIPETVQEKAGGLPEIGLLFIPVRDYPMANKMLRERAGYIHNAYCKVEDVRKGGATV